MRRSITPNLKAKFTNLSIKFAIWVVDAQNGDTGSQFEYLPKRIITLFHQECYDDLNYIFSGYHEI